LKKKSAACLKKPDSRTVAESGKLGYSILCFSLLGHMLYLLLHQLFCFCLLTGSSGFCPRDNMKIRSMSLEKGIFSTASSEIEKLELFLAISSLVVCLHY